MEAEFIPGKKFGSSYLVDTNNFLYSRVYNKKDDEGKIRTLWKCIVNKSPNICPATATTKKENDEAQEMFSSSGKFPHNHVADISKIQKLKAVDKVKRDSLEQPGLKPRAAFADLAGNMDTLGEVIPIKYTSLARSMCRVKSKGFARPKAPKSYKEVLDLFPEDLRKLSDGSPFLIYAGPTANEEENQDPGQDDPIMLIFLAEHGAERLRVSNLWLCDGTFKTSPHPFLQVYIIFAQTGSGKVLPAAFCLLPQKSQPTYKKMWQKIFESVENYTPTTLLLDMEPASAQGFISVFGEVDIVYCYFHWRFVNILMVIYIQLKLNYFFRKALRDQLGKKHCLADVNKDKNFNQIYRMITALAFVPPEVMVDMYITVLEPLIEKHEDTLSDEALDWCDYFCKTYIGARNERTGLRREPKIKPVRWSQFYTIIQDKPCTTNSVEGFNSAWNSNSVLNSTVWVTVDHFRKEESIGVSRWREDATFVEKRLADSDDAGTTRQISQREKISKLKNLCLHFPTFSGVFKADYLKLVSAAIED